ncbi:hypothetical protein RFI_32292 [Reticulomyxa filosa]|uniref:Uncharacterized protein n=1 Tax=Reticulomyxa filosa TaxID=46433 RepID=X6LTY4_RETFI|nr:hypothetical protein RFI_32292 [Reticulomyxa filosa]|eukprot:ETO05104.1 hypothetical protein RFI_32292 [Reticulomyxa filosa]
MQQFNQLLLQYKDAYDKLILRLQELEQGQMKTQMMEGVELSDTNAKAIPFDSTSRGQPRLDMHPAQLARCKKMDQQPKTCYDMGLLLQIPMLKNGVDFLLINESNKIVTLKNNGWNNFKFGVYLLREQITLTVDGNENELGYLKIRTSHLWIKHCSSKIDCSHLGFPSDEGPGRGGRFTGIEQDHYHFGGGGGYGRKGRERNVEKGDGKSGNVYGDETLSNQLW